VKLTDDEIKSQLERIRDIMRERHKLDEDKKLLAAQIKRKDNALEEEQLKLAMQTITGEEERTVEVVDRVDPEAKKVFTVRTDTWDILVTRDATSDDLQLPLIGDDQVHDSDRSGPVYEDIGEEEPPVP
jgi:hypothetical protein